MNKIKKINTVLKGLRKNNKIRIAAILAGFLLSLAGVFIFRGLNSSFTAFVFLYWLLIFYVLSFEERWFFLIAIFFLIPVPFVLITKRERLAEAFAVWEFIFISLGLCKWIINELLIFVKSKLRFHK